MSCRVALLRGINVGGKNVIRMAELRACFEAEGYADVRTYIQSGNVLFDSTERSGARLERAIEQLLADRFGYAGCAVVRSAAQLGRVVRAAPEDFGRQPERYRYDVLFVKAPLRAKAAMAELHPRAGVDRIWPGSGVVYAARLIRRASQSRLSKLAALPIYPRITVRNWNTTTRLLALLRGSARA